ncbi:hypothetical protein PL8927_760322 [Planktothrix serta PCC 8927]|uniref:Uncharacterized protein n=1 Tax=Planktothrix serta PCC 8927 TaxID=671068 RepID=A0A7Z9BUT2_9CYAN|nr:hypothetical protein PL8927_760322 [Planktothrix serta PCC 8927]
MVFQPTFSLKVDTNGGGTQAPTLPNSLFPVPCSLFPVPYSKTTY